MHSAWPGLSLMVPGAHAVGAVEPVAHAEPAGHAVQSLASSSPGRLEKLPAGHASWADAPRGQKLPPVHRLQLVAPTSSWYSPLAHGVHSAAPGSSAKVPREQIAGAVAPAEHDEPAGQLVQSRAAPTPERLDQDPAGHGSSAEAPGEQYCPSEQARHAVCSVAFWYEPALHAAHDDIASNGATLPGAHGCGGAAPPPHELPRGQLKHCGWPSASVMLA